MEIDAIIVLGGGIKENGVLSQATQNRVKRAVQIFKKTSPKGFIVSGRWSLLYKFIPKTTEAEAAKEFAIKLGITANLVFPETQSMETVGNAYFAKKLFLEPRHWKRLVIVTSDFHRKRTEYAFKKVLGSTYTLSFSTVTSSFNPIKRISLLIGEFKLLKTYKKWLDTIPDGDDNKIKALLDQLPGYSKNPKYTVEELIRLIKSA